MKTEQYCIFSLIFLTLISGSMYYNTVLVDTQAYVPSVYFLQGKILQDDDVERATQSYAFKRPVEIALVALIEPVFGIRQSYSLLNVLFFIATTALFYYWLKRFFYDHEQKDLLVYVGALLYAVSLPLILYATRVLVDVAGYLTIMVGLFVIEWVFEKKEIVWYHCCFVGLALGFFLLVRDSVVILIPYFMLRYLWYYTIHKTIKQITESWKKLSLLFFFVSCLVIPELIFMWYYNVGFLLTGKGAAITAGKYSLLGWLKFIIVHGAAFHVAYIFAYFGWKQEQNAGRKQFYLLYGICALIYIIGIQLVALTSPRFTMVVFPVLLPLAAVGILSVAEKWKTVWPIHKTIICCFLFYAIISFLGAWFYPSRTLIVEDAGGNAVINAVLEQVKMRVGALL